MKVAVLSVEPMCGKTSLIQVLGSVYSRSQNRDVAVFSTGSIYDNIEIIANYTEDNVADSPHIVKSMIESAEKNDKDLLNYGIQAGEEHVYYFNTSDNSMSDDDKSDFLLSAIEKIPADLTLVEICGDVQSDLNKAVLKLCDCSILLVEPSLKSFRHYKPFLENMIGCAAKVNMAVTLSRLNAAVIGDKAIAAKMGIPAKIIHRFPYNINIPKLSINKQLNRMAYDICACDSEVAQLRMPMLELMQYIFDSPTRKIIRDTSRWYK